MSGLTHRQQFLKKNKLEDKSYSLKELSDVSKVPLDILQQVYNRGVGAAKTEPTSIRLKGSFVKNVDAPASAKLSKEQWAMARVYSFLNGNPKHDNDLRRNLRGGEEEAEGAGLGDLLRGVRQRVSDVFQGIRRDYPPSSRRVIASYGNGRIVGMTLRRAPIQQHLNVFFNLFTRGEWNRAKAAAKYDDLYHLSLVAMVEMPGQAVVPILIEKNQVINISPTVQVQPGTQFMNVEFEPGSFTLAEFLQRGQQFMGDKFWLYDGFYNNCQDFLLGLLAGNGIQDVNSQRFIKQPLGDLIKRLPWYSGIVAKGLTNMAALVDVVVHGAGKKYSDKEEKMYGSGRYDSIIKGAKGDLERMRKWELKKSGMSGYEAETIWESDIINKAAEMSGLPPVPENPTSAQMSIYIRALRRYLAFNRQGERGMSRVSYAVPAPGSSNEAEQIESAAVAARMAEWSRTAAAVRVMSAPLNRALDSTQTRVRPMSEIAVAAAGGLPAWRPQNFGTATRVAAGLEGYETRRAIAQDADEKRAESDEEGLEHVHDMIDSRLVRGNIYLNGLGEVRDLEDQEADIARAMAGMDDWFRMREARAAAFAEDMGVMTTLRGSDEREALLPPLRTAEEDIYADMPPLEAVGEVMVEPTPGMGAMAAARPAAAAAVEPELADIAAAAAARRPELTLVPPPVPLMRVAPTPPASPEKPPKQTKDSIIAELKRLGVKGYSGKNKAQLQAMLAQARPAAAAAAAPYPSAAAAASAGMRMNLSSATDAQITDLLLSGYTYRDLASQFNSNKGAVRTRVRRLPGAMSNAELNAAILRAEEASNAEDREEAQSFARQEADEAAADADVRAVAAAQAPRATGEGKPKRRGRPALKKPKGQLGNVAMEFKDLKGEHVNLIGMLGEAANKLTKEAKSQAAELKNYETNKARRTLMSKKEKEALAGLRRGGEAEAPPKRGRGRPRKEGGMKPYKKGAVVAVARPPPPPVAAPPHPASPPKTGVGKKRKASEIGKGAPEKWIQEAVEKPGAFTAQAKRAKMSVAEFADHVLANPSKYKETTRKRAQFAKNMEAMAAKKKPHSKKGKEGEDK